MGHKRICNYDNARCQIKRLIKFNKFQFIEQNKTIAGRFSVGDNYLFTA